jgi:hypothetical protein
MTTVREVIIDRCHLVTEEGPAVWWLSQPGGRLRVSGSVTEGVSAIWVSFQATEAPNPGPAAIEFVDSTVASRALCVFVYRAVPKHSVQVTARRNVFGGDCLFGTPTLGFSAAGAEEALRKVVSSWSETDNVYDHNSTYLAAVRVNPMGIFRTQMTELADWNAFWKAGATGSVEGDVRFRPRAKGELPEPLRLDRVEGATGEVPDPVGAGELPFR